MMNEKVNVVLVFLLAVVVLLWYAAPDRGDVTPFIFAPNQVIDAQSWIWVGGFYCAMMIFACMLWLGSSVNGVSFFRAAFILQVCLFVEYWLNYNKPWGHITIFGHSIPVHIGTLRLPILLFYAIRTFMRWRT